MEILALIVTLGGFGFVLYKYFKKDEPKNNGNTGGGGGGGYTWNNNDVAGELPKENIK